MDINQFAVYQLKNGPETRQIVSGLMKNCSKAGFRCGTNITGRCILAKCSGRILPKT